MSAGFIFDLFALSASLFCPPVLFVVVPVALLIWWRNHNPSLEDQVKQSRLATDATRREQVRAQIRGINARSQATENLLTAEWQDLSASKRIEEIRKLEAEIKIKEQLLKDLQSGKADFTPRDYNYKP